MHICKFVVIFNVKFFSLNKNIYFKQKYAALAFGNIVALTVDSVNSQCDMCLRFPHSLTKLAGAPNELQK